MKLALDGFDTDVVIIGLGPTGATAANLLGLRGVRTLVLEQDATIFPRQRAIAIDEDALRVWQGIGLLEQVMADMRTNITMHFHNRNRIFLSCNLHGRGRQGLPGMSFFHQPKLEQTLRDGLAKMHGTVETRVGHRLVSIDQDAAGVRLGIRSTSDMLYHIRARYLIGCDGGSSTTRQLLGIALPGRSIDEPWIDIQARTLSPQDASAPLDFNFIADPARPGADCQAPMGYHRWEFRLRAGEDPDTMNSPDGVRRLLALRGIEADTIDITQSWVYVFHVRQAERWQERRAFLCGDAAHIMPPFVGQGISSGIRDVANLCWKLAAVLRNDAEPSLLNSYETERRPNVMTLTRFSLQVGAIVMVQNPFLASCRDMVCRIAARLPWLRTYIGSFHLKPDWISGPGSFARRRAFRSPAGQLIWQPWVIPAVGYRRRLDDLLGQGWAYVSWRKAGMPAHLQRLGVREIVVHERSRSWRGLQENEAVDIDDRLRRQFRRYRVNGMLIRPDRFIYGCDRDDLSMDGFTSLSSPDPPARAVSPHVASLSPGGFGSADQ